MAIKRFAIFLVAAGLGVGCAGDVGPPAGRAAEDASSGPDDGAPGGRDGGVDAADIAGHPFQDAGGLFEDAAGPPADVGFTEAPPALSTRSLTSHALGSDPGRIAIGDGRLTVDLTPLAGATVYRATFDPYLDPEPQLTARRLRFEGLDLPLREPRKLAFDATEAVATALGRGDATLVLEVDNMAIETASLDVLCSLPAPVALPEVENLAARHEAGDTMLTFTEREPVLTGVQRPFGEVQAARASVGPSVPGKVRYRIYRSTRPIDDLGDVVDAELVDEIAPMSGWADELIGFDIEGTLGGVTVGLLPVADLTPALPGTAIYVRRHRGPPAMAWYFVRFVEDGAERFDALTVVGPIDERSGPGMALLTDQQTYEGQWVFTDDIFMRLDYFARWSPVDEHPTPSQPYHYRVGVPLDPPPGRRPGSIVLHAFGGSLDGWSPWYRYEDGAVIITANLQYYTSFTAFHEFTGTLGAWEAGTAQPFFWARTLGFVYGTVASRYDVDVAALALMGGSMGGAGTMFWGMRSGHVFAYLEASVGNAIPAEDIPIRSEFEFYGFGPIDWDVSFSNEQLAPYGYPVVRRQDRVSVWDYFDSRWWLENNPRAEMPFLSFANAPNDSVIAWAPAWANAQAIHQARQPHQFVWGQQGHGQLAESVDDITFRRDEAVIAFSSGSLDADLGRTPSAAAPVGQRNLWYRWFQNSIVDEADRFVVDLVLRGDAPSGNATVDVTPRRCQAFRPGAGSTVRWRYGAQTGQVQADAAGVITVRGLALTRTPATLELTTITE